MTDEHLETLIEKADDLEKSGDYVEALEVYDSLLAKGVDNARVLALRGYCNYLSGHYRRAIEDFDCALGVKSDTPTTLYFKGLACEKLGWIEDALSAYNASARLSPEADVFINIGLILQFRGALEDSRVAFARALELDPSNETASNLLENLASIAPPTSGLESTR